MSLFGKVFGKPSAVGDAQEDEAEVERLLQQVADARHAGDRRDAMSQLSSLLQGNPRAQYAISSMGLPVLLSVLQEDRDDLDLLKGALEVLQLSVALPQEAAAQQQQATTDAPPPPALINADLFCRAPDNVLLLLGLLRPEPEGCDDFYVRYGALQLLAGLMQACPEKLQACVLSSPLGVTALMDCLSQPLEVVRNEALLLLVGLCNGCPQIANIVAFEGAFDKLLAICGAEGGPAGGDVTVQDAAELINNLLRDNVANQRLFREMGHINQLPALLAYTPPAAAPPSAAPSLFSSASQFMDPSIRAAAGAAANAAANSAVGSAAAAAMAAAGAAASTWPLQVAANYLCLLETARVLLAAPHSSSDEPKTQDEANWWANQNALGGLGVMPVLVALSIPGPPSAAVRAQALFCLGDLVWGHAQLQEQLAGQLAAAPAQTVAGRPQQQQPIPYLQAVLRVMLHGGDELERAGASHLLAAFCQDNNLGQLAVLSTVQYAAVPSTFGEELVAALLCRSPLAPSAAPHSPSKSPLPSHNATTPPSSAAQHEQQQLVAGRAGMALSFLLQHNHAAQMQLLAVQIPSGDGSSAPGELVMARVTKLLQEGTSGSGGKALPLVYNMLRLCIAWCAGCTAAVSALLLDLSHLPLLSDLVGRRVAAGDVHTAGLAAVLLGVCLIHSPGSLMQQQQQLGPVPAGSPNFDQLLDVLLSRVGLSQFYGAIDEMKSSAAFQAARLSPMLPAHITRSMAAALLEAQATGGAAAAAAAAAASSKAGPGAGLVGGALGLLYSAAGAMGPGTAISEAQPYDQAFTQQAVAVAAAVQQLTLNAFSAGGGSAAPTPSPGIAPKHLQGPGGLPIPLAPSPLLPPPPKLAVNGPPAHFTGSLGPLASPLKHPQQQHQQHGLLPVVPPPPQLHALPQLPGTLAEQQHQQQQPPHLLPPQQQHPQQSPQPQQQGLHPQQQQQQFVIPEGPLAAVAAQLPGDNPEQKLLAALEAVLQLQGQVEELRSRNRSLAEDLIRVSQSKPGLGGGATANGGPMANGVHEGQEAAQGDADARVAAQLRASRAEMEAGALKQQLSSMQERWSALEAEAAAANEAAEEAKASAAAAQDNLAALSTAYNDLEAHAFRMEEQLKQQEQSEEQRQQQQQQEGGKAVAGVLTQAEVEVRIKEALEKDWQQRQLAHPAADANGAAAASSADVESRIAAAVSEAVATAEAEAGEEMEDLLACLGEEQAKVEVLSGRLADLGEDVEALLATVAVQEGDEGGGQDEAQELL